MPPFNPETHREDYTNTEQELSRVKEDIIRNFEDGYLENDHLQDMANEIHRELEEQKNNAHEAAIADNETFDSVTDNKADTDKNVGVETKKYKPFPSEYRKAYGLMTKEQKDMGKDRLSEFKELKRLFPNLEDRYSADKILDLLKDGEYGVMNFVPRELLDDRDFVIKAVELGALLDSFPDKKFHSDKGIALAAVKCHICNFQWISEELRSDREVALEAFKNSFFGMYGTYFNFVGEDLRNDKDFIISLLRFNPDIYLYVPSKYRYDKDVILATLENDYQTSFGGDPKLNISSYLQAVPNELRGDEDIMLAANFNKRGFYRK